MVDATKKVLSKELEIWNIHILILTELQKISLFNKITYFFLFEDT